MIKLLAIDMDGTCLNDKKLISEETLLALRRLSASGVEIVPTTGRALRCCPHQLTENRFYRYVITSNGACVTDLDTDTDLYRAEIPCRQVLSLLEECRKLHLGVSVHAKHEFILQGRLLQTLGKLSYGQDAAQARQICSISGMLKQEQADIEEIQLFYFSPSARKRLEQVLSRQKNLIATYSPAYVELYAPHASKGTALSQLANQLHIQREEIACIGDADNDLSMFASSGLRFAMGNAVPELAAQADVILPSNNDSGVAEAINRYLLP